MGRVVIIVCRGPDCGGVRGSAAVYDAFRAALDEAGEKVQQTDLRLHSCFGRCSRGPNVLIRKLSPEEGDVPTWRLVLPGLGSTGPAAMYNQVTADDVAAIVDEHCLRDQKVRPP